MLYSDADTGPEGNIRGETRINARREDLDSGSRTREGVLMRVSLRRYPNWRGVARALTLLLLTLAITACGAPEGTAIAALVPPTATATATATATPTPTPTPTVPPTPTPTATPTRVPTRSPTATATVAPRPTTPVAVATTVGGYTSNWRSWESGEDTTNKLRRTYDAAQNEYRVAVLADDQEWSFFAPEGQKFQDFTLEVEGRKVDGDDSAGYGLVFRRQPRQGDKASERYIFYVTAQGRFSLFQVTADGTSRTLRPLDAPNQQGVIKVGDAPNRLQVTSRGNQIVLAINGTSVYTLNNATITQAGEIGIFAKTPAGVPSAEFAFKNLQLKPNP